MFRFSVAVTEVRIWLVRQGVAAGQIDAGYALNGWWLYAPSLPSGRGPEPDVAFVTTMASLPCKIANAPEPGYEAVHRITWPALWAASDTIYVWQQTAETELLGPPIAPVAVTERYASRKYGPRIDAHRARFSALANPLTECTDVAAKE